MPNELNSVLDSVQFNWKAILLLRKGQFIDLNQSSLDPSVEQC